MKKFFLKRLIAYPICWSIVWYMINTKYPDFPLLELFLDGLEDFTEVLPFALSPPLDIILFGLVFGYVYGTASVVFKVRMFKGGIFFLVLIFKMMFSAIFAVSIGYLLFAAEILLLPLIIFLFKTYKGGKMPKLLRQEKTKPYMYEKPKTEEDLIREMERIVTEYKNLKG